MRRLAILLGLAAILAAGVAAADNSQSKEALIVPGRIEGASEMLSLGASTTGTISQVLVKAGDHVQAGEPLLRIGCRDLENEVLARQFDLAASEAVFARVSHGSRPEEIAIGEANVNLANARLQEAQKEYDRAMALHEGVTVTRVQIDQAERDARMAAAMLEEVRAKLALLKVGSREEDVAEARSRHDAAKARLDSAAARLSYCTVPAPISGVILSVRVGPGQLVSLMAPATLITMVDDSKSRVRVFVKERDAFRICSGEQGQVSAEGSDRNQSDGRIEEIAPAIADYSDQPGPGRYRAVVLSLSKNDQQFSIGQSVTVKLVGCGS